MPAPTFTPGDEQQDERLNPGQQDADRRFGSATELSGIEKRGTVDMSDFERNYGENADSTQEDANIDKLRNKESEGEREGSWRTNVTKSDKTSGRQRVKSFFKKRGGIVGILALFGIGGAGIAGVLGPLAMPINLMENLSLSNDSSSTAFERRALHVLGYSTEDSDPICANSTKLSLKCRMGRISNSALRSLERKGVTPVFADGTTNTDKRTGYPSKNPTRYTFDMDGTSRTVNAADLPGFLADNPKAAAKILGTKGAINLRVKAWSGKYIGKNLFAAFGTSKNGGIADGKGTRATAAERYTQAIEKMREKIPGLNSLSGVADNVKAKVANQMDKSRKGGLGYTLAVAGCIGVKAPGYIAAGVAAVQLAQILPIVNEIVLSPGSKIKASGVDVLNSATAEDVDMVGTLLTAQTENEQGEMTSALDSPYLLAALGINKNQPAVSTKFTPGYSMLTSPAVLAANDVNRTTAPACNAIMSPAAMYSAFAIDSAITVAASTTIIGGLLKVAGTIAITEIAIQLAEAMIGDAVVAAVSDLAENDAIPTAEGEELGDVLGISAASFFSAGGMVHHLPTLTESQLSDFTALQTENEAFQRDMDIASLSPFDISSRYTFLGSIIYDMNMSAVASGTYDSGMFASLSNLARLPFASLSQNAGAATNFTNTYCGYAEDFGLTVGEETSPGSGEFTHDPSRTPAINMAGMPCTGITTEQASMSTEEAISLILEEGWINEDVNIQDNATIDDLIASTYIRPDTPLSNFIESCGNPTTGDYIFNSGGCIAATNTDSTSGIPVGGNGDGCFPIETGETTCIDPEAFSGSDTAGVKNPRSLQAISVFLLDFQVLQSINGEDGTVTAEPTTTPASADRPAEAINKGEGWGLADATDYSSYGCDQRTSNNGTYKDPEGGYTILLCKLGFNNGATAANVASVVSVNVMDMLKAAEADGVNLGVHTGALKVGDPGYSNTSEHRYGLAVDLGTPNGNSRLCSDGAPNTQTGWSTKEEADAACTEIGGAEFAAYEWLNENASRFGMFNRGGEPWHWSTSGN